MAARKKTTKKTAKKKTTRKAAKTTARKAARKAARKTTKRAARKATPRKAAGKQAAAPKKKAAARPKAAAARPAAPAATPAPAAPRPAPAPATPASSPGGTPAGGVSAADVNLGHIMALRSRVPGFKQEAFQEAKRLLAGERYPSIEDAARAVAEKAVALSNQSGPDPFSKP